MGRRVGASCPRAKPVDRPVALTVFGARQKLAEESLGVVAVDERRLVELKHTMACVSEDETTGRRVEPGGRK